jgi:hypothetical protein
VGSTPSSAGRDPDHPLPVDGTLHACVGWRDRSLKSKFRRAAFWHLAADPWLSAAARKDDKGAQQALPHVRFPQSHHLARSGRTPSDRSRHRNDIPTRLRPQVDRLRRGTCAGPLVNWVSPGRSNSPRMTPVRPDGMCPAASSSADENRPSIGLVGSLSQEFISLRPLSGFARQSFSRALRRRALRWSS